jgi:hypothetical protein
LGVASVAAFGANAFAAAVTLVLLVGMHLLVAYLRHAEEET